VRPQPIQFLYSGAMLASITFIPIYAKEVLGLNRVEIGLMVFAYSFVMFSSAYFFGRFSDIYGRRKMLYIGLFACGTAMALQAVAWNFVTLFLVRCLVGLSLGLFPAALLAYAHEGKSKMGKFTSWGSFGWGVVTLMAGAFVILTHVRVVFILASLLCFIAFTLALFLPKREFKSQRVPLLPKRLLIKNLHYYFPYFTRHSMGCAIWTFWPLILIKIGADPLMIGFIMFVNAFTQFIIMFFISDRIDTNKLFLAGLIISVVTFIFIYLAFIYSNLWVMIFANVLLGSSWACLYAGSVRYLLDNNKEHASATGLFNSVISTSAIVGPLLATGIILLGGGYSTILIMAIVGAALSIGFHLLIRLAKGHYSKATA